MKPWNIPKSLWLPMTKFYLQGNPLNSCAVETSEEWAKNISKQRFASLLDDSLVTVDDPKRKAPFKKQTTKKQKNTFKSQPLTSISSNPYHWKKTCKNKTVPLLCIDSQRHSSKRSCWSSRRERIAKPKRVAQANHKDPLLDDCTGARKKHQEETTWTPTKK